MMLENRDLYMHWECMETAMHFQWKLYLKYTPFEAERAYTNRTNSGKLILDMTGFIAGKTKKYKKETLFVTLKIY